MAVGALIESRVVAYRRIHVGEPDCPYQLRWNHASFWFGIRVSDSAFVVEGNHRRPFESAVPYFASLKKPSDAMITRIPLESLSKDLGVSVFVSDPAHGPLVTSALRAPECRALLLRIDVAAVRSMFVSPVQIRAIADFETPQKCAEQIMVCRELMLSLWRASAPLGVPASIE
jgi:hypothetical protein